MMFAAAAVATLAACQGNAAPAAAVVDAYVAAENSGDYVAMGALFSPDATFVRMRVGELPSSELIEQTLESDRANLTRWRTTRVADRAIADGRTVSQVSQVEVHHDGAPGGAPARTWSTVAVYTVQYGCILQKTEFF